MSARKFAALAVVLLILAALYMLQRGEPQLDVRAAERVFPELDAGQLRSLSLISGDSRFLLLHAADAPWEMKEPIPSRVDQGRMRAYLQMLHALEFTESIDLRESENTLKDFGLLDPSSYLTFRFADGEMRVLSLGRKNEVVDKFYAGVNDSSRVMLLSEEQVSALKVSPSHFRLRRPLVADADAIERFVLQRPGGLPAAFVREAGQWSCSVEERELPTDGQAVREAVEFLSSLEADNLVDGVTSDLQLFGLEQQAYSIFIVLESQNIWGESDLSLRVGRGIGVTGQVDGELITTEASYLKSSDESVLYRFLGDPFSRLFDKPVCMRSSRLMLETARLQMLEDLTSNALQPKILCESTEACDSFAAYIKQIELGTPASALPPEDASLLGLWRLTFASGEQTMIQLQEVDTGAETSRLVSVVELPAAFLFEIDTEQSDSLLSLSAAERQ